MVPNHPLLNRSSLQADGLGQAGGGDWAFAGPIVFGGSVASAVPLVIFTTCGGFTYSALRHRTASIWPPMVFHFFFNFVSDVSTPQSVPYLIGMLSVLGTIGFLAYGLYLLRDKRARRRRVDGVRTGGQHPDD